MFKRVLHLPTSGTETFFLWGPRQTGKTTLLQGTYSDAFRVDLPKADEFRRYLQNPELRRGELAARKSVRQVVIDEVQKVSQLLGEAHWLHERRKIRFALCGSSARKVKRGQANLLGGRAVRYELHGLTAVEIRRDFDLNRMLNHGYLPLIYQSDQARPLLNGYVAEYLKEEVAAEGLVRNLAGLF
ncbi:MAG TPA: AAA family ATPase [Candidatus Binatia bacterium]